MCGNQVIEPDRGEDCDGFADPDHGANLSCERCRYVCNPVDAAPACPAGWGCGRDGTCRHGTAQFTRAADEPVSFPTGGLAAGDLDGDLATEVIGSFASRSGMLTGIDRVLDARITGTLPGDAMAMTDLDRDGLADLLRPSLAGVFGLAGVRGGDPRPTLALRAFDADATIGGIQPADPNTKLVAVRPDDDVARRSVFALLPAANTLAWVRLPVDTAPRTLAITGPPASLLEPTVGNLDGAEGEEFVVGYRGESSLYVIRTDPDPRLIQTITLPAPLARSPIVGRIDGDAHPDLVVPLVTANGIAAVVLGGDGTGGFALAPGAARFAGDPPPACADGSGTTVGGLPLVIADLDEDGASDYVIAEGVVRAVGAGYCRVEIVDDLHRIGAAVVLDVSGDGRLDVAWITPGDGLVRVATNAGGGVFDRRTIPVSGAPTSLHAGKLNWDDFGDLLVGQHEALVTTFEVIAGTDRANDDVVLPGPRVPGLGAIAIGPLGSAGSTIDDLTMFGLDGDRGYLARISVTPEGDTFFSSLDGQFDGRARFIAVGDVDGSGARDDIVSVLEDLGGGGEVRWGVWRDQTWYLTDRGSSFSTTPIAQAPDTPAAIADLDGDRIDELVFASAGMFVVYDPRDLDQPPRTIAATTAETIARLPVDGGDCLVTGSSTGATIHCDVLGANLAIPVTAGTVLHVGPANVDADADAELVVVTTAGVEIYDVVAGTVVAIAAIDLGNLADRSTVCPADLDGDGVTDLVIGVAPTVVVLWGVPHDEGRAP